MAFPGRSFNNEEWTERTSSAPELAVKMFTACLPKDYTSRLQGRKPTWQILTHDYNN